MGPISLFQGSKSFNSKTSALGQSTSLSPKEKKYMSNVEKALTNFDSVNEWADYIAFLVKLQKSLLTNPDINTINWIPYDFQVSITLSKCILPSLPSGVHKKAIELYCTIFNILQFDNLGKSITIWLPGILPLMSYASISIKQDLIDLYKNYICQINPIFLRSCFKSILLSLFAALDDTTSEFFQPIMELIDNLKIQLNDNNHFWQCILLIIITSPDKRIGAMEYLTKKIPSFIVNIESNDSEEILKDSILSQLSNDAISCIKPDPGLLIRALCSAMNDSNLFVQRGFFDILLSKMPLNSSVYQLFSNNDKNLLFINVINTVLRKDMSLNRRLWNWLLGPDSIDGNDDQNNHISRLQYFKTYSYKYTVDSLLNLISIEEDKTNDDELLSNYINTCTIVTSIMDKWEIGQSIVPQLFIPIMKVSHYFNINHNLQFDQVIKRSNQLFDAIDTNIIWSNILKLIKDNDLDLDLFILQYYNVEDEEMLITHIPIVLLSVFALFQNNTKWIQLLTTLISFIPQRALLPLELADSNLLNVDYYNKELRKSISDKISKYYSIDTNIDSTNNENLKPFHANELSAMYLGFTYSIINDNFNLNDEIFFQSCKIYDNLVKIIPISSNSISWNVSTLREKIKNIKVDDNVVESNIHKSFGISYLFKYLIKDINKLESLKLLKITIKLLWICLQTSDNLYQVEIVERIWKLETIIGSSYIEAALCNLLLEIDDFEQRIYQFNILWIHLNNDTNESISILHKPLYIILNEINNDTHLLLINKWIKSLISNGTSNRIFRIICANIFNNDYIQENYKIDNMNLIDFGKISNELEILYELLKLNDEILNNFKLELCVIDNNKQIEFIKNRNWDISTYKSFMVNVLTKIMEIEPTNELINSKEIFGNFLKCMRLSLKLINLLIDGSESNFNLIFASLINNCEENCLNNQDISKHLINSYYLETITKMIKLSSKNQHSKYSVFENNGDKESINLLDFITIGIKNCQSSSSFDNWIELILCAAEYYPDLICNMCMELVDCMCSKLEKDYLSIIQGNSEKINLVSDSICELISGIEIFLLKCHKHLGFVLSDKFGFGNISNLNQSNHKIGNGTNNIGNSNNNNNNSKETGFFGSVIQGVFQVENTDDKNEGTKRKRKLIEAFRRSIFTVYDIWINCDFKQGNGNHHLSIESNKTSMYNFNKIKFRSKKLIEQNYDIEPLETIEALIECYNSNKNSYGFKLFKVLDDSKQNIILGYILDSIVSRVNYSSLDENKRSLLISRLDENILSKFLVEYCANLNESENLEKIWPNDVQNFIKDSFTNISYYKYIYPNLLKFLCLTSHKLQQTSYGRQKRVVKEISENFIKMLNLCITTKVGSNQNTLSNVILKNSSPLEDGSKEIVNEIPKNKIIFREEVCDALIEVIPHMHELINDIDKLNNCFSSIINGISGVINKGNLINFDTIPQYIMELLIKLSENLNCNELKVWKNFCNEIIQDNEFFKMKLDSYQLKQWNGIMKRWILNDDNKLNDIITNKLILSNSTNTSSTLLFNWNDEVDILNSNIPHIKRIIYLLLINEKDKFVSIISLLIDKINEFFFAFRQMTKYCLLEGWIFVLLRVVNLKFSENHLTDTWIMINKSIYYLFTETFEKIENNEGIDDGNNNDNIFNIIFLQGCKLLDILIILNEEEFQLNEWIFISDNLDGIHEIIPEGNEVGIVEKISKLKLDLKGYSIIDDINEYGKKVPLLKNINKIDDISELMIFFKTLKIKKYENEYRLKEVDYECITDDIFFDLFNNI